ncbi:AI-2E family transporter [Desulfolutivibrio sulfoxidireducens]|uniref:AI-2E family transporter n=1 Tax=Desulfolutivibrio sulfoxidireducens TaxID=2773299 RepID=UPI00159E0FB7|nr:AI-2E family transporter [Desulfolutivibrio sulfoxidireducens]QLA16847.1 AI-2E family transporter [Desulfolutivibrio sulfoxidireducens]
MNFDILQFIRANKVLFIWGLFFALVYLARMYGLFGLVFITFILCFTFNNVIAWLCSRTRIPRVLWTITVYVVFLAVILTILSFVLPKLVFETTAFVRKLPEMMGKVSQFLDKTAVQSPDMAAPVSRIKKYLSVESIVGLDLEGLFNVVMTWFNQITSYVSYFLLGTLFSFLILLDFPKLRRQTQALRHSRLRDFHAVMADSVAQFALTVGTAFQAQMLIALANTLLTAVGLWVLGIHPIVLLCSVVFCCGLIPVLGVFISSVPILLVAFNIDGLPLVFWGLCMVVLVHLFEAYILNPRIISVVFKISPLLILIIVYLGHVFFGLWGMLLGVPVSVFIYRHVIVGSGAVEVAEDPDAKAEC